MSVAEERRPRVSKLQMSRPSWRSRFGSPRKSIHVLAFTTINELASNLVFVSLLETAYAVGSGGSSVGVVLVIQAGAQLLLGSWAGSLVDRIGIRKAATFGTIAQSSLAIALAFSRSVSIVYFLAFLLMLARLLIIPARLAVVRRVSSRNTLLGVNVALEALVGVGLFFGPSLAAAILLLTNQPLIPPVTAGLLFFVSALPSLFIRSSYSAPRELTPVRRTSILVQVRGTWQFIKKHQTVRLMLTCLFHSTMVIAATMPLLTPLSRQLGLGDEGTGVLVAALGFGNLIGPALAPVLRRRVKLSIAMHLTALATPVAVLTIDLTHSLSVVGTVAAIAAGSLACAGLRVIVNTILQRLTPQSRQGSLFGAEQTLLGLGWFLALAVITALLSMVSSATDVRRMILFIGGAGLLMTIGCWAKYRRKFYRICSAAECVAAADPPERSRLGERTVQKEQVPQEGPITELAASSHLPER